MCVGCSVEEGANRTADSVLEFLFLVLEFSSTLYYFYFHFFSKFFMNACILACFLFNLFLIYYQHNHFNLFVKQITWNPW